jgi:hypothetical protein
LVGGNRGSGALEYHRTLRNQFRISKHRFCEPYIRVNSAIGFWSQYHHRYVWKATYGQCQRGISIYEQSQLHSIVAQAQWPVYRSWLYWGDTIKSCPGRLVRYLLGKRIQPTIRYRFRVQYSQSPSFTHPVLSGQAIFLPSVTTGTLFERNQCSWSVQKYQINLTQRRIRRFGNYHVLTAIPCRNWRGLGRRS